MTTFKIVSAITDSIIAILALFIAFIQLKNEIRKKREETEKDNIMNKMILNINNVVILENELDSMTQFYENTQVYEVELLSIYYQEALKRFDSDIDSLKKLYEGLLAFESEFSLSYGFGRYIDVLREKLPILIRHYTNAFKEHQISVNNVYEDIEYSFDACYNTKKHIKNYINERKSLEPYLQELRLKYKQL